MDSLTQVVLGSAVAYAVLGRQVGRRAALYGAVLGTVPDLDVFIPFGGAVEDFTFHRSFSHSFLVQLLISPLIAWLLLKLPSSRGASFRRWSMMIFLCLSTHALLDTFTVYGTQLLWPLTEHPFAFSSLFIIDPLYTLPLLAAAIAYTLPNCNQTSRAKFTIVGLSLSTLYIIWSLGAKWHIDHLNTQALAKAGINRDIYVSTPAPFTTLLWRSVVVQDNQYFEIFTSVFDNPSQVSINAYSTEPTLLQDIEDTWPVKRLQWFTKGKYSVSLVEDKIVISDLRMGIEGAYVFSFEVAKLTNGQTDTIPVQKISARPDISNMGQLWARVFDPTIVLTPEGRSQAE